MATCLRIEDNRASLWKWLLSRLGLARDDVKNKTKTKGANLEVAVKTICMHVWVCECQMCCKMMWIQRNHLGHMITSTQPKLLLLIESYNVKDWLHFG